MPVFLETERMLLRRFTPDDAGLLLELDGDPHVMRYIGPFGLPDRDAYRERIETVYLSYYERFAGYGVWPAVAKDDGEFLGWFAFRPAEDYRFAREAGFGPGEIELGYRLRRAAWGRGYATEGSRALVAREFSRSGTDVIVGVALAGNAASRRVLEKAGLRQVGEFALPGFDQPAVKYVLRREEYAARNGPGLRSVHDLSTEEAYLLAADHFGHDLPSLESVENEDWGRDYVLQRLASHSAAELAAAGLTLGRET